VASVLLKNGKFNNPDKNFTRHVNPELKDAWNAPSADQNLCSDFTIEELISAISSLKPSKAPGPNNLHPEFFLGDSCILANSPGNLLVFNATKQASQVMEDGKGFSCLK